MLSMSILSNCIQMVLRSELPVGIRGSGKFRGMLLERLHGTTVDKIICTRDFHDVHYIYAMLYSIFTALDRAQGALGEQCQTYRLLSFKYTYEEQADWPHHPPWVFRTYLQCWTQLENRATDTCFIHGAFHDIATDP